MKVKAQDRNVYWREQKNRYNQRNRPDLQVRTLTKEFLSKKEALTETQREESGLLEALLDNIRGILTEGVK